jgi:putative nucleotidyltransferase with HDIG domain
MGEESVDATASYQTELFIGQVDRLWPLPGAVARFLCEFNQLQLTPPSLAELVESDTTLAFNTFSILHQQGLRLGEGGFSIRGALDELSLRLIRDSFLSVKLYPAFGPGSRADFRKELTVHSIGVACCCKAIAETIYPKINSGLAYLAGLLHDIGKFALDQEMPKGFARIVEEARTQKAGICSVEQKHLGTDHTILGKRLGQKLRFPDEITLAIWLHRTGTDTISQSMPAAKIAEIVHLADSIVRQSEIGESGSYDSSEFERPVTISAEQLEQIRRGLGDEVGRRSKLTGLDLAEPQAAYVESIQTTAAQLVRDNTKLSSENYRMQVSSSYFDFITEFLLNIDSMTPAIEAAETFAAGWQKFYQTGKVCLYLPAPSRPEVVEAVVVESPTENKTILLKAPSDSAAIPRVISSSFRLIDAAGQINWLFEQLEADFELSQTKVLSLVSGSKAVGALVFELRYPVDINKLQEQFEAPASIGGVVLDMARAWQKQQCFAERIAVLFREGLPSERRVETDDIFGALAEMAGGAAHELNNPLSLISGRAQLLAEAETDADKKDVLEQIRQNAGELSGTIDCLMAFAEPAEPRPAETAIRQILDEAVQLTAQKTNSEKLNIEIEVAEGIKNVFVDSGQIVSAISNIFCNCIEAYEDSTGPIKVAAADDKFGKALKVQIIDKGCGMDAETVEKAVQPFFSAKPAGRKRGMGLANAQRIIQINKGRLEITSEPGKGTCVTVYLPYKEPSAEDG